MHYLMIGLLVISNNLSATDFNDGIGYDAPIDDTIKVDHNIKYLTLHAKAKADKAEGKVEGQINSGIGNIEFGIGAKLKNVTIINNSDNKGAVASSGK